MAGSAFSQDSNDVLDATYVTLENETSTFANSFSLGTLTTGLVLNTVTAGVSALTQAAEGTDYLGTPSIGVSVQAFDATLQSISALGTASGKYLYTTGIDTWAQDDITALGRLILSESQPEDVAEDIFSGAPLTTATVAGTDKVLIQDTDDSDSLKTVTAQSIADLSGGGGGVIAWTSVAVNTGMAIDNGYVTTASIDMTLPATAAFGTVIKLVNTAGNFTVKQNAGQNVVFNTSTTTTGAGGSIATTATGQAIELVCTTADTTWHVISSMGVTFTVV